MNADDQRAVDHALRVCKIELGRLTRSEGSQLIVDLTRWFREKSLKPETLYDILDDDAKGNR